jgi:glycogen debranching enzyme
LHEVIQEALQRHADGVSFVERNAGPGIDNDMTMEGGYEECACIHSLSFVVAFFSPLQASAIS